MKGRGRFKVQGPRLNGPSDKSTDGGGRLGAAKEKETFSDGSGLECRRATRQVASI